jgi:hypothetical protein
MTMMLATPTAPTSRAIAPRPRNRTLNAAWASAPSQVDAHPLGERHDRLNIVLALTQDGPPGERQPLVALGRQLPGYLDPAGLIDWPCLGGVLIVPVQLDKPHVGRVGEWQQLCGVGDHQELGGRGEQVRAELTLQAGMQRDGWLVEDDGRRGRLAEHGGQDEGLPCAGAGELDRELGVKLRESGAGIDGDPDGGNLDGGGSLAVLGGLLDLDQVAQATDNGLTRKAQRALGVPALLTKAHKFCCRVNCLGQVSQKIVDASGHRSTASARMCPSRDLSALRATTSTPTPSSSSRSWNKPT